MVVSVCRRLDGMPLAIELAAARLRSMSLAELHDRLDQRFRLLTGGSRTALERQQTLRATVGWSYSLLTGAEQLLLARLSVFAGGFGLDAAEAVCGSGDLDVLDVADLLGSLVDKSLVVAEPAGAGLRYRLLETIRLFAAERLVEAGEAEAAAVAAAHCAHFLAVAEEAAAYLTGPEQGSWLARLDADQANLRRAAGHAAGRPGRDRGGAAPGRRARVALLVGASRQQEAFGLLVPVLRRPDAGADPALFAAALVTAAYVASFIDVATARQLAEQAVQVARQLGDERLLSRALAALCGAYYFAGELEAGLPFGQESVERARRLGDDELLAWSLMTYLMIIGTIDPARSLPLFAEAIACTERSGDHLTNSVLHNNAGGAALEAGDIPAARAHLEAAAQAAQQIGYEHALVQANLGGVLRAERDLDGARSAVRGSPADRPPERRQLEHGRRHPRPGLPGRRCGRLGPGSRAARRRAGPSGPDRQSVARSAPRVTAGTAWTKRVRTWAMSSWSGPTPRAWRSASRRPSTWLSRKRARPDRYRRQTRGSSLISQARAAADTVLASASDTGRACPAAAPHAVAKRCRAPADRAAAERRPQQQIVRSVQARHERSCRPTGIGARSTFMHVWQPANASLSKRADRRF